MNCIQCGTGADCTDGSGRWWCKVDFPYTIDAEHNKLVSDLKIQIRDLTNQLEKLKFDYDLYYSRDLGL